MLTACALEDVALYIAHALAVFGEGRAAFGGDRPVVLLAGDYRRWVETLDALTAGRGPAARRKLWAGNARRFYRLEGVETGWKSDFWSPGRWAASARGPCAI